MPNHVKNVLKFSKLSAKDKEFILNNFTDELVEETIYPLNKVFDFDKIIPEPKTEDECPDDCKVNKDSHIMPDKEKPWFDWYTWHNKYWGTKWNAYDVYTKVGVSTITFVFSTAWNTPFPVYEALVKNYPFEFEVRYADEDIGSNCGKIIYDPIKTGFDSLVHINTNELSDPNAFAMRLWDNY